MADSRFVDDGTYYGKSCVKVLRLHQEGLQHYIREFEVTVHLGLLSRKDFIHGDNGDIIATDSQKNTVYALAKTKGLQSAEQFGLELCQHFLDTYYQVSNVRVHIEEAPWVRINQSGREHNHAFTLSHQATRYADAFQQRYKSPVVGGGLKNMKILKSTQSGFVGFVRDKFTSLPETKDRIFSTIVDCKWVYNDTRVDFDKAWETVRSTILDIFAGPPVTGIYSPSVQNTLYIAEKQILEKIPQVERVDMEMPNVHYFLADLAKIGMQNNNEVFMPTEKPFGYIRGAIERHPKSKL
ncbi:uricase-like [Amphiura filiformis]|uniref:uricase-like n=1 Tax=Amphiura filiformis TaxID=82378 RepID=UPI003B216959